MTTLLVASNNQGKIKEIRNLLAGLPVTLATLNDVGLGDFEVIESGETFVQNANLKAKGYGEKSNLLTLADDSGLAIDALMGRPGVYSARYAPTDEERIQKVLKELINIPENKRTARFVAAICLYDPQNKQSQIITGSVEGFITNKPTGKSGFGYDPIFYSPELGKTFGEATESEKNRISHRGRALAKIKPILEKLLK